MLPTDKDSETYDSMDDAQETKLKTELKDIYHHIDTILKKIQAIDPEANNPPDPKNDPKPSD